MAMAFKGGHTGKILRLDLSHRRMSTINTKDYQEWVGGQGMATAIFFDLVKDKTIGAFDPRNVICIMAGPFSGTLVPGGGRLELVGISPQAYPREQFTRSGMGGRFSAMLKFAGWDGIVIEGASDKPVWLDIRNGEVQLKDAGRLWGLTTYETQEDIWREISSGKDYGKWMELGGSKRNQERTTQRPAILSIGPAGENRSRIASITHDSGNSFGGGGFGGVWGSKNLKAISILGTGSVPVADPKALLETRQWLMKYDADLEKGEARGISKHRPDTIQLGGLPSGGTVAYGRAMIGHWWEEYGRPLGCYGCTMHCRQNVKSGELPGGESQCIEALFYQTDDIKKHGKSTETSYYATQLLQAFGIDGWQGGSLALTYVKALRKMETDTGNKILPDNNLPWDSLGEKKFVRALLESIAKREGVGADLAEGICRAARKWGRLEEDMRTGLLDIAYWGYNVHWGGNDGIDWAYESMFHVRDINMHDLNKIQCNSAGAQPPYPAEWFPERIKEMCPYWEKGQWVYGDEHIGDLGDANMYTVSMARTIQWHTAYWTFWKNSTTLCDWYIPSWFNTAGGTGNKGMKRGISPELESRFFKAVTGIPLSYENGLELGRRIWNMERAILVLQGRHRKEEWLPPYPPYNGSVYYTKPMGGRTVVIFEDDRWKWKRVVRQLDKDKFDQFKTLYYQQEGWDTETGGPTRKTLEDLRLKKVADELAAAGKLPK